MNVGLAEIKANDEIESPNQYEELLEALEELTEPMQYASYVAILRALGKITTSPKPLKKKIGKELYDYTGEIDEDGNACGYGVATYTTPYRITTKDFNTNVILTWSGTFREN